MDLENSKLNKNEEIKGINENELNENELNEKVNKILRQTDISKEDAIKMLIDNNYDEINIIKNYLGINNNKKIQIKSINQEIYKQLRRHLDNSMAEYRLRLEKNST